MKNGPLAQRLPSFTPGREFLSANRANSLKVPFSRKEAMIKLACLEGALNDEWFGDMEMFKKQQDLVLQFLSLGAYSLPGLCLSSVKLDMHLRDCMQKELSKCMNDLRKGLAFVTPCRSIDSLLRDYIRVSTDYLPYCFYNNTRTLAYATTSVTDEPMISVRLNCRNGSKDYKLVRRERIGKTILDKILLVP